MRKLIQFEEAAMFAFSIFLFAELPFEWWWFLVFILVPDIGMIGYAFNNKAGAILYNLFHHRAMGVALYVVGVWMMNDYLCFAGIIFFGHACMDRIFGYGLKYEKGFKFTHLGEIGKPQRI